ncbi:hypothetical protein HDU84_006542 [Entophlyctis sp. JEL0112]|nr:hypothetical protein HDU84_006542 [Entophlyctis sp. JEL0112]
MRAAPRNQQTELTERPPRLSSAAASLAHPVNAYVPHDPYSPVPSFQTNMRQTLTRATMLPQVQPQEQMPFSAKSEFESALGDPKASMRKNLKIGLTVVAFVMIVGIVVFLALVVPRVLHGM